MTITEIAELAGVSKATVSRVLNERGDVSRETRDRVLEVVREHNFTPNVHARGLIRQATLAGIILADDILDGAGNPFFSPIFRSTQATLEDLGYHLMMGISGVGSTTNDEIPSMVREGFCAGIVTFGHLAPGLYSYLAENAIPTVSIEELPTTDEVTCVAEDTYTGALQACEYLLELGHRRIAFVQGRQRYPANRKKLHAYRDALAAAGLPFDEALVVDGDESSRHTHTVVKELLASETGRDVTAIFCSNDDMAMGALDAIAANGRKVPEDISIIGFDDIAAAANTTPPLSTVHVPKARIGETAARQLVAQMKQGIDRSCLRILLPTTLVRRESCCAAPAVTVGESSASR